MLLCDGLGNNNILFNDCWVGKPGPSGTGEWTPHTVNVPPSPWPPARHSLAASVLAERGYVNLMGGVQCLQALNDVWGGVGGWESGGDTPWPARYGHCAVSTGGYILLMGGIGENSEYLNDVWVGYANNTGRGGLLLWSQLPSAPWSPRAYFQVGVIQDRVYLCGGIGSGGEGLYEIWTTKISAGGGSLDGWMQVGGSVPYAAGVGACSAVFNGKLYVYSPDAVYCLTPGS